MQMRLQLQQIQLQLQLNNYDKLCSNIHVKNFFVVLSTSCDDD
jgi:hypothetical protein